jgi:hypothetical protein
LSNFDNYLVRFQKVTTWFFLTVYSYRRFFGGSQSWYRHSGCLFTQWAHGTKLDKSYKRMMVFLGYF